MPSGPEPARIFLAVASVEGGIAHCAHYQAEELQRRGITVTMLCSEAYPWPQSTASYRQLRRLKRVEGKSLFAKLRRFTATIANHWRMAWHVAATRSQLVLLDANTEYFSFLWAWPHLLLRALGVTYLATFHDPLRQVRYGSPFLHRAELALFYATLRGGLIHSDLPDGAWVPRWIDLEIVPHGPFVHQARLAPAFDLRARLGIPAGRKVLLSFGLICDYKNLDLLIEALAAVPQVDLVIAGRVKSSRERPADFYREVARQNGVADRVHLIESFIPENDISAYFAAADVVALTYSAAFVSQSGVLQLATAAGKPVLASSGDGPLRQTVIQYGLGEFVAPGSAEAAAEGLQRLVSDAQDRGDNLNRYNQSVSWEQNIDGLIRLIARAQRLA